MICILCGQEYPRERWALGYDHCTVCGEEIANAKKHTVVPFHKSNYQLVTDRGLLKLLNKP